MFKSIFIFVVLSIANNACSQIIWQKRPSPNQPVISIDVSASNVIFAATSSYGIYKSSDDGVTWTNISQGLPDSLTRVIKASSDNTLYAGTGSHGIYKYLNGVWSSANNGLPSATLAATSIVKASAGIMYMMATTGAIYKWDGSSWSNITFNFPSLGKDLYVFGNGTLYGAAFTHGVYKFDATNNTWSIVGNAMPNNFVLKLAVNSQDTIIAVCNSNNVFKCAANGGNWLSINTGLPSTYNINFITVDLLNNLFVGNTSSPGSLYLSATNGASWMQIATGLSTTSFNSMAVSASNKIFTGASGVFRSSDSGSNWTDMNPDMDAPRSVVCMMTASNGMMYLGSKIGPWRSLDSGLTWQLMASGISHLYILQIMENAKGDILLHGYNSTPKGAIYRSTNNGSTWTQVAANGCDLYTKIKQHRADTLWAISRFSGATSLSYSINDGATWLNNSLQISAIWDIDVTKDNTLFLSSETEGISRSDNGGSTFNISVGNSGPWYGNAFEIEIDDNGYIIAGSDWWTHSLWYSTAAENGNTWTQFTDPDLTVQGIQDLVFDAYNNMYLACENGGVKMAANATWSASTNFVSISSGLPSATANMLELSFDTLGFMYAVCYTNSGLNAGLFRSNTTINPSKANTYTFTGNGDWHLASNWKHKRIPPASIPANVFVTIDPIANGECLLNVPLTLQQGAILKIKSNRKLRILD
jgi:photosystem II stability/assembly factor-like uncharacterized protein